MPPSRRAVVACVCAALFGAVSANDALFGAAVTVQQQFNQQMRQGLLVLVDNLGPHFGTFLYDPQVSFEPIRDVCPSTQATDTYAEAMQSLGLAMSSVLTDVYKSAMVSSEKLAETVVDPIVDTPYFNAARLLANTQASPVMVGSGSGYGYQIQCGGHQTWGWGSGIGGGIMDPVNLTASGFGGGGGGGIGDLHIGGGGQCSQCSRSSCKACSSNADQGASTPTQNMDAELQAAVDRCQTLWVCGHGGGGVQVTAPSCQYNAQYFLTFQSSFHNPYFNNSGTVVDPLPPQSGCATGAEDYLPAKVASECNTECGEQGYQDCWCPCYRAGLLANHVSWAASIRCEGDNATFS